MLTKKKKLTIYGKNKNEKPRLVVVLLASTPYVPQSLATVPQDGLIGFNRLEFTLPP